MVIYPIENVDDYDDVNSRLPSFNDPFSELSTGKTVDAENENVLREINRYEKVPKKIF